MALATRVLVVGGGLGGLTCAFELERLLGEHGGVTLIDAGDRAGGVIHSEYESGYRIEWAANGFPDRAPLTLDLVRRLDLEEKLEPSSDAARKRFLYRDGRLHLLPTSPLAFLRSSVLSVPGRLRAVLEPFAPPAPAGDETVYDFARRRLGVEAARILVDALVSGVFAGDTNNLSLASSFPLLKRLEDEGSGLLLGLIRAERKARQGAGGAGPGHAGPGSPLASKLVSFRDGMGTLTEALAAALEGTVRLATPAKAIEKLEGHGGGFRVLIAGGMAIEAQAIVLAMPAAAAADLVRPLDPALGGELAQIPSAPIAVVAMGFAAEALPTPLDGFGFLVPRGEGLRMLGCLWDSSIFRFRAPVGRVLSRTMIGGALDPEAVRLEDLELVAIARREMYQVLRVSAEPDLVRVIRHRGGIPQYVPGHGERLARIDARLAAALPGIHLTGSGFRGIAVNRVIDDARAVAERVLQSIPSVT